VGAMMPLVSVLTPTIEGRGWFLHRCRKSVRAQTYGNVEQTIVKGDGLTATQAFQKALDSSYGEYVIPVSDDDWIAPHAVETLLKVIGENDVVFARTLIVSPGNTRLTDMGGAVMWRRTLTDRIGGFDPRYSFAGDTDLYSRFVMSDAKIVYYPEPLYFLTEHALHGSYVNRVALAKELEQIQGEYPDAAVRLDRIVAA
jgi:glycosyltransferase involved in cell wall biosynthesis